MELGSPHSQGNSQQQSQQNSIRNNFDLNPAACNVLLQDQGGDTPATAHFHSALPKSENYGALKA
jgi:hypothetical protein